MTGDEVAVVLETCHALYKRSRKVADLTEARADKTGQNAGDEGNVVVRALEHKIQDNTCDHRRYSAGDAALDGFVRADLRRKLMLAEPFAAKQRKRVAHPSGDAGDRKNGYPILAQR